jgi:hypothetical protein
MKLMDKKHGDKAQENEVKMVPPSEIFSSRKHSMDYVSSDGVKLRTGYADKRFWFVLILKELLDNAVDFFWKHYRGSNNATITVNITKDDRLLCVRVSNTNDDDIQVFKDLDLVFNYEIRYGSKQNEFVISRGMLGDAMKQILAFGYVLIHLEDDRNEFTDRQWEHPLIIRHNKKEWKVLLHVDKAKEEILASFELSKEELKHPETEIEVVLPLAEDFDFCDLLEFCKVYPLLTTDISFKFRLVDISGSKLSQQPQPVSHTEGSRYEDPLEHQPLQVPSSPKPRSVIIEYPALHPISTEWNNITSVHYYKKEEFLNRLVRVHNKSTLVYDVLRTSREGTNLKKNDPDNYISIGELITHPDRDKKVERLYYELKNTLPPPHELSLPYKNTKQSRKNALTERITRVYPGLDPEKAVYKVVNGIHHDKDIEYPFFFEIIAIPYSTETLDNEYKSSKFIGTVNYSLSPRSNSFEGRYAWTNKRDKDDIYDFCASTAEEMLSHKGFKFYDHAGPKVKLPSIIIANLVSPRVDYHGHDKSRVDTKSFIPHIMEAIQKMAKEIQTFRAAGYTFYNERRHDTAKTQRKIGTEEALEELIMKIKRGEA